MLQASKLHSFFIFFKPYRRRESCLVKMTRKSQNYLINELNFKFKSLNLNPTLASLLNAS